VMKRETALDMVMMLNKAAEEGTGRRARLDGIRIAGKTGTTNAYRDAWFVAFTGNFVGGIWMGNDDYAPTNRMTGGSLPAMTWQAVMKYAHQGIELKPLPGIPNMLPPAVAQTKAPVVANTAIPQRPAVLTRRGAEALINIERLILMEDAARAVAGTPDTVAPASQQSSLEKPDTFVAVRDQTTGAPARN